MRAANILTGIAVVLWFALALLGRSGLNGVVAQQVPGHPNMEQINYYVVWPLFVVAALLLSAWLCNAFQRWSQALGWVSSVSLLAIFVHLFAWSGGV